MSKPVWDKIRFDDVRGKHLLAALSGGADSVALLCMLAQARSEYSIRLTAAHLHHGIRGEAADGDAQFCRDLCRQIGVELIEARADVPSLARSQGEGLETAARDARYRFLHEAKEKCGADFIALAHHLDDQAETILMHLMRGTGPQGICAMRRMNDVLYRPLLDMRKEDLRKYLEERRIPWREDATNAVSDNPRNALRLNVLPEIEKSYPRAPEAIARYARLAGIENDYLERAASRFMAERVQRGGYGYRIDLSTVPDEAILRRAMRRICGDRLDALKADALCALSMQERGRISVFKGLDAEKTGSGLYFLQSSTKPNAECTLVVPGTTLLPGVCRVRIEAGAFEIDKGNPLIQTVDARALEGAVLRTRREGDRISPLGGSGSRLLSDYLTDKKVERPLRDWLPVIACGKRIIWAGGIGIAREAAITADTTRRMRITFEGITEDKPEEHK